MTVSHEAWSRLDVVLGHRLHGNQACRCRHFKCPLPGFGAHCGATEPDMYINRTLGSTGGLHIARESESLGLNEDPTVAIFSI